MRRRIAVRVNYVDVLHQHTYFLGLSAFQFYDALPVAKTDWSD
jgi:hypothetical protein